MSIRDTLASLSRELGRPVILRGEGAAGGHDWQASRRGAQPVLACRRCPVVWWPDRSEPRAKCRQRPDPAPRED